MPLIDEWGFTVHRDSIKYYSRVQEPYVQLHVTVHTKQQTQMHEMQENCAKILLLICLIFHQFRV